MKNWTRRHTLIAGIALLVATNAVALLGVAYNRSGDPESVLTLTQRELERPYAWRMNRENSGVSLHIDWRLAGKTEEFLYYYRYASRGSPAWLDQAKMASLGFDVGPPGGAQDIRRWASRQLEREVLLVLEMDGPAYQESLQRARQYVAEQDARLAALPRDKDLQRAAKVAHEALTHEENDNSRLFAVDAGLDQAALRAKFPDRNRYAIVRAKVHLTATDKGAFAGYIAGLSIDEVNVPHEYHALIEGTGVPSTVGPALAPFEARTAFGQRLEPWLLGMTAGARTPRAEQGHAKSVL